MTNKKLPPAEPKLSFRLLLLAVFSFATGRLWRLLWRSSSSGQLPDLAVPLVDNAPPLSLSRLDLQNQHQAQAEIQQTIQNLVDPPVSVDCHKERIIASALEQPKDGFASEFQYVARLLQMAVSTNRRLVLTPQWRSAYEPPGCDALSPGWDCLWEPISKKKCPVAERSTKEDADVTNAQTDSNQYQYTKTMSAGILPQKQTSTFFDVAWYGSSPTVWSPTSFSRKGNGIGLRADVIPHWERSYGRFWVRAQMAHYLWKPNAFLREQIKRRYPANIEKDVFIGFHVRYTDNIQDFQKHFARNATLTRDFARFMEQAEAIRGRFPQKHIRRIYLATDNPQVIQHSQQLRWKKLGWQFISQTNVQRSSTQDRMWFREGRGSAAGAMAADIEVLRRADFLVGSFQSNVFRLACELNVAWHVANYPLEMQRHWAMDVEWYEDP